MNEPKDHEATANSFLSWKFSANTLQASAKRVYVKPDDDDPEKDDVMCVVNGVYGMLLGYAVECSLKGLWVKAGEKIVNGNNFLGVPGAGEHQLRQLAQVASQKVPAVTFSADELNVLGRLSKFVLFAARYPIPKKADEMAPVAGLGGDVQAVDMLTEKDFRIVEGILTRLLEFLN